MLLSEHLLTFKYKSYFFHSIDYISRFLANKYNLAGRTNLERAQADEIVDAINDLFNGGVPAMFEKDEAEKKKKMAAFVEKTTETFGRLERRLDERGGQFFAGNALSWADLQLFFYVEFFNSMILRGESDCTAKFPLLRSLNLRVGNQPNIRQWVINRPQNQI